MWQESVAGVSSSACTQQSSEGHCIPDTLEVRITKAEPCKMMGYRVVILGAGGVGKTSIVTRFVGEGFSLEYNPTVDDIYRHIVRMPGRLFTLFYS